MVPFWTLSLCLLFIMFSGADSQDVSLVVPDPSMVHALEWLDKQREPDYGFQDHTAEAVVAFQLSNASSWYTPNNLLNKLTVKQMDIEILVNLFRRHETPPSPKDLALYSMALNSLCRDPRQFYGHDLISNINHQEMLLDLEFAVSSLAICISGNHVRKRQIRRLLDITEQNKEVTVETISMVVIALHCIIHDHRNRNLHHYLANPTKKLGKLQKEDGSFGDLKSSAFAIQALESTDPGGHHWNRTTAVNYVKFQQNDDGSFGDDDALYTTILVLFALGPQGLVSIKDLNCQTDKEKNWSNPSTFYVPVPPIKLPENSNLEVNKTTELPEEKVTSWTELNKSEINSDDSATVSYTLWVGSNVTETYTINVTTENNDSFYNVMQLAAQRDNHFCFLSTEWPNGHYVHTLAGYKEEPMSYHYWLLYKLPMPPDLTLPPPNQFVAPVGVDELLVEDGDHFLFWYKKL
ncbi:hypothetical protein RUM43_010939 [Polyplax serrata]|uniref:Uncharacterized protein n=1 Tax=Polyplax serrata TaxID=468196 RepID=A0AAN8S3F1_POLSC